MDPILALALTFVPTTLPTLQDEWEVDAPHGPESVFDETFDEGTWISVDVAPDGRTVVFDLLGHLYEMPVEGGEARALTEGRSWNMYPRYSPDGTRIAFTSDRGGSNDLWVLDRASGELENVTKKDLPTFQGTWSLDGRALYGTSLNMKVRLPAYRFDLLGGAQEIVPAGGRHPVNHFRERPGEEALYFVRNSGSLPASGPRIERFDMRTGEVETYVDRPGGAAALAISPDGARMVYVHRDDLETVLVLHDFGTEAERVVLSGLDRGRLDSRSFYGAYPNLAWHPNGREVFLSTGGGIVAVDVDAGTARPVPFSVRATRPIAKTIRFPTPVPRETTTTRAHRWSQPAEGGVLFEALGDLWLAKGDERTNLTRSDDHETCPVYDAAHRRVWYASWNDDELGSVWSLDLASGARAKHTSVPSQYGSLALSPDGTEVAFLRGDAAIRKGTRLERQTGFELVVLTAEGEELVVTDVDWARNRYAMRPPTICFSPDASELYYTEYVGDALTLKRVDRGGLRDETLVTFPNATRAVVSPDFRWIAYREYHRTFVAPYDFVGKPLTISAADGKGTSLRVDGALDGDFTEWTADGTGLYWTRGTTHYEKDLADVLVEEEGARATPIALELEVASPGATLALTGVRAITMDGERRVLEDATIVIEDGVITTVGTDADVPAGAEVLDLDGRTVTPGWFDSHGHYGSPISALNVIEQRLYGLHANLAYGITTMYDVYGTTQKDFWVDDMLRAGKMSGPRIFSVGDPIFVTKYRTKMHRPIESAADAMEVAHFNRDHGATALKDYSNHTRAARQQLAAACRANGLNLVAESFANPQMNLTQVVDGFTGLEHTMGLTPLYEDVLRLFAATEAAMTPTLIVVYDGPSGEGWFRERERTWEDEKLLHFFRKDELLRSRRPTHHFDDEYRHVSMAEELTKLYRRGVLLDMGAHGQLMGLGAHWEVEMFVHGGFTPMEALEVATINGFTHMGLDADLGSIEPGKLADLVVLRSNPLDDIRHTRDIELVLRNGFVHSGADGAQVWPDPRPFWPMYSSERDE